MLAPLQERYAAGLDVALHQALAPLLTTPPPELGHALAYSMGWANADGTPYTRPTGKRVRPLLLLLCAESAGPTWERAYPAAAAVEVLHNFSLVHDDIQDASDTRHGRPTVWRVWGVPKAINVGDALFGLAYRALASTAGTGAPAATVQQAWALFNDAVLALTVGQQQDMGFETRDDVTVEDYLAMIGGKTAALLSAACALGALLATNDAQRAAQYARFGHNLGLAFQMRDDLLGIWGDPSVTGKSAASDITSRKKSLPVLYGLQHDEDAHGLRALYAEPTLGADVVRAIADRLEVVGARAVTEHNEQTYAQRAQDALAQAAPSGPAADALQQLWQALLGRTG